MELEALKQKASHILVNQEVMKKMAELNNLDEIRAFLAEKGIEATEEQIKAIITEGRVFGEKLIDDDGELDIEVLEQVAGGGLVGGLILGGIFLIGGIANGASAGRTLACAGIAFLIGLSAPCP